MYIFIYGLFLCDSTVLFLVSFISNIYLQFLGLCILDSFIYKIDLQNIYPDGEISNKGTSLSLLTMLFSYQLRSRQPLTNYWNRSLNGEYHKTGTFMTAREMRLVWLILYSRLNFAREVTFPVQKQLSVWRMKLKLNSFFLSFSRNRGGKNKEEMFNFQRFRSARQKGTFDYPVKIFVNSCDKRIRRGDK